MRFFTDSKLQVGAAHREYAAYSQSIWNELPTGLRGIQGGMLPETMVGPNAYNLHDARIHFFHEDGAVSLEVAVDLNGDLATLSLNYLAATIGKRPPAQRLTNTPEDPDNDIMCHEVTKNSDTFNHIFLFAGGEELELDFDELTITQHGANKEAQRNT